MGSQLIEFKDYENFHFKDHPIFYVNDPNVTKTIVLRNCTIAGIPALPINGDLILDQCKIVGEVSSDLKVKGKFNIDFYQGTFSHSLNGVEADGGVRIQFSTIGRTPTPNADLMLHMVNRDSDIDTCAAMITNKGLIVSLCGDVLPSDSLVVNGDFSFDDTGVSIPKEVKVNGNLKYVRCTQQSIFDDTLVSVEVSGDAMVDVQTITDIKFQLSVGQKLRVKQKQFSPIPPNITINGEIVSFYDIADMGRGFTDPKLWVPDH